MSRSGTSGEASLVGVRLLASCFASEGEGALKD